MSVTGPKVKYVSCPSSSTVSEVDGQILFQPDTGRLYIDTQDGRVRISDVVVADSFPLAPIAGKLYLNKSSGSVRLYDGGQYYEWLVGNAVMLVDQLPTASATTVGRAYLVKSTGHVWVGTSESESVTEEVQVYPNGYKVLETVSGGSAPALVAGSTFTLGGTYVALDGNSYDWYSASGSNGHTYYLANYYSPSYSKLVAFMSDNVAPSSWDGNIVFNNGWVPTGWYSGGKTMEVIASLTAWYYQDDSDSSSKTIKLGLDVPAGAAQKVTLSGFGTNAFNGQYEATGGTVSVTSPNGTYDVPVYGNGSSYLFAANSPMDSSVLCWAVGTSAGGTPSYYSSKTFGYGSDMGEDMGVETSGTWSEGAYMNTFTVTSSVTYWQSQSSTVITNAFVDVTPSGSGSAAAESVSLWSADQSGKVSWSSDMKVATVTHSQPSTPFVTVIDSDGNYVMPSVRQLSSTTVSLTFDAAMTGIQESSPWTVLLSSGAAGAGAAVQKATTADVDDRTSDSKVIVPSNLEYAVRSVAPNVTVIPAATTSYQLRDSTSSANYRSYTYRHEPSSTPTYVLPAVSDVTVVHEIVLSVKFSSGALSCSFVDASNNEVTPLSSPTIAAGDVVLFLCRYEPLLSSWLVMPIPAGGAS